MKEHYNSMDGYDENIDFLSFCKSCAKRSEGGIGCELKFTIKKYSKGDYIAYKNNRVTTLSYLTQGRVKTEIVSDSGLSLLVVEKTAPFPIAATLLFAKNNVYPVDVIALEESVVMDITKSSVESQMMACQDFLRRFLEFNAAALQIMSDRMTIFAQKSIKAKVSYYLLTIEKKGKYEFDKSIISLSEYFGVERPSLSRAIGEMVDKGIVTYSNGRGEILNYRELHDLLG